MKVTFPHMGTVAIPLKAFFRTLGVEVIEPPPITDKTISLGSRYSPEFACLPLKINVGNYLEAYERGADTIIMAGGVGPCRFGYYAQVQREILADLGIKYEMIVLEPPRGHLWHTLGQLWQLAGRASPARIWQAGRLAWAKLVLLDRLDRLAARTRCREKNRGETGELYRQALSWIDAAANLPAVAAVERRIRAAFEEVEVWDITPLRVGLVGEIYTVLEPAANLNIERFLGELGVEVERGIYLGDWVIAHLFLDALRLRKDRRLMEEIAAPYLGHFVGGHGLENISQTIEYARRGFAGVIHIGPLTCMPEIVAKTILPQVSRDWDIPAFSFLLDEHTGEVGLQTRLEAFIEMLRARAEKGRGLGRFGN
jgi:predicted nucleotide-binding protein (sugar kinase/HSP70/actin superfamily)